MALKDEDRIDFDKLERELNNAVEEDKKYWQKNDAKFRAVEQKVATYDEFREIVQAAHLRPLEKDDKFNENTKFNQPWNTTAAKSKEKVKTNNTEIIQDTSKLPKNGHEFARDWKRYCKNNEDRRDFLLKLGGEKIKEIFKAEISMGLLGELMSALSVYRDEDAVEVISILEGLATANRFQLSLDFLSSKEKDVCEKLLQTLSDRIDEHQDIPAERVESLKKIYCK